MEEAIVVSCPNCASMQNTIMRLEQNGFDVRVVSRESDEGQAILAEATEAAVGAFVKIADTTIQNANQVKIAKFVSERATKKTETKKEAVVAEAEKKA